MDDVESAEVECRQDGIHLTRHTPSPLLITGQIITPLNKVRDLGVIIDSELCMDAQTRNVAHSCFHQLRQLRSVRKSLSTDARCTVAVAFIASHVDYCNGLLYSVSAAVIRRIQMVLMVRRCREISAHHSSPPRRAQLAASASTDTI